MIHIDSFLSGVLRYLSRYSLMIDRQNFMEVQFVQMSLLPHRRLRRAYAAGIGK